MTTLVCLGPEKSYGDCATRWLNANTLNGTGEIVFVGSNEEILSSLKLDEMTIGVVPVYNAVEGIVAPVIRHLMKGVDQRELYLSTEPYLVPDAFHVVGRLGLRIRHQLLVSDASVSLQEIKTVKSHQQALGQCSQTLRRILPHAALDPVSSTSGAAQYVAETRERSVAAIASPECRDFYGLTPLGDSVADVEENYTQFYILTRGYMVLQEEFGSGIALLLWPKDNTPGVLHDILSSMAALKMNVRYAPQIPLGGADNQVAFFIEMDTHPNPRVMNAVLTELAEMSKKMIVLGSFLCEVTIEGETVGKSE